MIGGGGGGGGRFIINGVEVKKDAKCSISRQTVAVALDLKRPFPDTFVKIFKMIKGISVYNKWW